MDEETGVDDGFGDFSRASLETDAFQSELDAAIRSPLPEAAVAAEPELEPEPEPEPAAVGKPPSTAEEELRELVRQLRGSLRASHNQKAALQRSLDERTRALVYWSTQVQPADSSGSGAGRGAPKIEELERIARAGGGGGGSRNGRVPSEPGRVGAAGAAGAAAVAPARQEQAQKKPLAEAVPPAQQPRQPVMTAPPPAAAAAAAAVRGERNGRGLAGLAKPLAAAVVDSRDIFEADFGDDPSPAPAAAPAPAPAPRRATTPPPRGPIPSPYDSEEEPEPEPEPELEPELEPEPEPEPEPPRAAPGAKVAVTAVAGADGGGATGVLGYITLPGKAHEVTFATVRSMIDAGAGGVLQDKPSGFVFVRGGAPVGRKQESKFNVSGQASEPPLIVIRERRSGSSPR